MDLSGIDTWRGPRVLMAIAAMALALGVSSCGGSDEDDGDTQASTPATGQTQAGTEASGGSGGAGGAGGADEPPASGPALSGDVEEAREGVAAVDDVYEGFGAAVDAGVAATDVPAGDTLAAAGGNESLASVCDLMSKEAKRQTIVYARRSAGLADVDWTCEKATGLLLRRAGQTGRLKRSLRAKIVGVNVEGDRATASVRFGGKGAISTVPLVKEDGEWKLAAAPSGGGGK